MDRAGNLVWCTPQAGTWLGAGEAEPGKAIAEAPLPEAVVTWGLVCATHPDHCKPLAFVGPRTGKQLKVSYVGQISSNEILLRLVSLDRTADERVLRARFGLTAREAEVLLWVGRGKTNRDIAEILKFSPRTVDKYLEQVFDKNLRRKPRSCCHKGRRLPAGQVRTGQ